MLPEELARVRIDKQLKEVGWEIVSRSEYIPNETLRMIFQKSNQNQLNFMMKLS